MPRVTLYTSSLCPLCRQAKRLLEGKGVCIREIDIAYHPELSLEMRMRSRGRETPPQVFIGDLHVGGWDELFRMEERGELDEQLSGPRSPRLSDSAPWRGVRLGGG